ncbi:MAG: adenylate/guanylate cyclase domain-containing protein [Gammaproteobacteria bacterium]|nr:adenylate/guanylate cyclase domain-containing protein [Gammaproteobacteria bacterium]
MKKKKPDRALRRRLVPMAGGVAITLLVVMLHQADGGLARAVRDRLDWLVYDLRFNQTLPDDPEPHRDIVIVDIDEASLAEVGHWPWPRSTLARLVDRLAEAGVVVVGFDVVFAEDEENPIRQVLREATPLLGDEAGQLGNLLAPIDEELDGDLNFARSIRAAREVGIDVVLGYALTQRPDTAGQLGAPLDLVGDPAPDEVGLEQMPGYTANLPVLQRAAERAGFFVSTPDADGVNRSYPLILGHDGEIYPSLALETARRFLFVEQIALLTTPIREVETLEAVSLDGVRLPTDGDGRVMIPYPGPPRTFDYVSAADVLEGSAADALAGRIALIGTCAVGLVDIRSTPVSSVYPGVEVHASVLAGIIDNRFPHRPPWADGVDIVLTFALGVMLSLVLPFSGALLYVLASGVAAAIALWVNLWLWIDQSFVTSLVGPLAAIVAVTSFNLVYGFFTETLAKRELKSMFGQYVPPQLVDEMSRNPKGITDAGERREMTVLFCDIRGFTTISEQLTATELKDLLNRFFTPMTEIIFHHRGTIDKYVGDMIMAFWGAPLDDPDHARNAIETALTMLDKSRELRGEFARLGYPEVNIGIGLNTGPMNVGNMGSKFRRSYTVLGDAVNLGSRLEGLTKFYGVQLIVGEETHAGQEAYLFRQLDRVRVKGKKEPTRIYTPVCRLDEATAETRAELAVYEKARRAYIERRWDDAEAGFRELKAGGEDLVVYDLYLERIAHLRDAPPGPDWDGVFVHNSK